MREEDGQQVGCEVGKACVLLPFPGRKILVGNGRIQYENLKSLFLCFIFSVRFSLLFVALCPTGPTCTEGRAALGGGTVCVCCGLISYQVTGPPQTL